MVVKEYYSTREDGVRLYKSYSTKSLYIRKKGTNEIYSEAVDVEGAAYTYEETDTPIEVEATEEEARNVERRKTE